MERITIRRITIEDKHNVLKIRDDLFDGKDFLSAYYDFFVTSPHVYPAAVIYDGKIQGFDATVEVQNMVSRADDNNNKVDLQLVTNEYLSIIFNTRKIREYIAPNGVIAVNWVPLRPEEDNIPFIRGPEGSVTTCILSDLHVEAGDYMGLLSIATVFPS